jgi:hemoglobin-like flavoprotein
MTAEQMKLVKNSWKKLRNVKPQTIGDLFYAKLFFDHPGLRKLFPSQMDQQHKKLIDMINYIVLKIDNFETVKKDMLALALNHEKYGAKAEHYKMIGSALLWTLEKAIGKEWNADLEEAWNACYSLIAQTMLTASKTIV